MNGPLSIAEYSDRQLRLNDPDRGRELFKQLYQVPRIDVLPGRLSSFDWLWKIRPRGAATVISGHSRSGEVVLEGITPQLVLILVHAGAVETSCAGEKFRVLPRRIAGVISAGEGVRVRASSGVRTLNIRIDGAAMASQTSALLGIPVDTAPRFDPCLSLRGRHGEDLLKLARLLEEASSRPDSSLGSPLVIAHLREALMAALLVGQNNNLSHLFHKPVPAVDNRAVRVAEEILSARAAEPLSIAEVAGQAGVSLRSLERSFKAARGLSLRDFLKAQRLELAHRRLRAAAPGTTVTQVLYASGFGHPGEFSLAYRKRFGETPSQTLRRANLDESLRLPGEADAPPGSRR